MDETQPTEDQPAEKQCDCANCQVLRLCPMWLWSAILGFESMALLAAWVSWLNWRDWHLMPGGIVGAFFGLDAHTGWLTSLFKNIKTER